jgi:hypothetical protein
MVTESAEGMATDDQLRVATPGNISLGVLTARSSISGTPMRKGTVGDGCACHKHQADD